MKYPRVFEVIFIRLPIWKWQNFNYSNWLAKFIL